jgi:hypothetical protein
MQPMPSAKNRDWRVAYHEAAHAVAAHTAGKPFASVTIAPDGSSRGRRFKGRTVFNPPLGFGDEPEDVQASEVMFRIVLAGVLASKIGVSRYQWPDAEDDLREAARVADVADRRLGGPLQAYPTPEEIKEGIKGELKSRSMYELVNSCSGIGGDARRSHQMGACANIPTLT